MKTQIVYSKQDSTVKYVFQENGFYNEFSWVDNGTPKDIVCASCQTSCNMGCKFCFLSYVDLPVRNLSGERIFSYTRHIVEDRGPKNNILLVSYMGCGEPLNNIENVIESMNSLRGYFSDRYELVRFGLATIMPSSSGVRKFIKLVKKNNLPVKLHLSLHATDPDKRKYLIPGGIDISQSINLLQAFREKTGNSVELHYSLINGFSDREDDINRLLSLIKKDKIPVKFLKYNDNSNEDLSGTEKEKILKYMSLLKDNGVFSEYYEPPGVDVGASCGQFLKEFYK